MYEILKLTKAEDEHGPAEYQSVETFEEAPAPAVTLAGRLQALIAETGVEHIAREAR